MDFVAAQRLVPGQPLVEKAIAGYVAVAQKHHYTLSIGTGLGQSSGWRYLHHYWCHQLDQLKEDVAAFDMPLTEAALKDIHAVMRDYPMPF